MTRDDLLALLADNAIAVQVHDHPAVFRVEEGEATRAAIPGLHTKNLFLKDHRDRLWLVSAAQDSAIDLKALPAAIGSGRLSFASPARLEQALGVTPGSVTALALVNDTAGAVGFVLDARLAQAEVVNFHPLVNTATASLTRAGFRAFLDLVGVRPRVVDFTALAGGGG